MKIELLTIGFENKEGLVIPKEHINTLEAHGITESFHHDYNMEILKVKRCEYLMLGIKKPHEIKYSVPDTREFVAAYDRLQEKWDIFNLIILYEDGTSDVLLVDYHKENTDSNFNQYNHYIRNKDKLMIEIRGE